MSGIEFNPNTQSNQQIGPSKFTLDGDSNKNGKIDSNELQQIFSGKYRMNEISEKKLGKLNDFINSQSFDYGSYANEAEASSAFEKFMDNLKSNIAKLIGGKLEEKLPDAKNLKEQLADYNCTTHPKYDGENGKTSVHGININGEFMMLERNDEGISLTRFDNNKEYIPSGNFKNMSELQSYLKTLESGSEADIKKANKKLQLKNDAISAGGYKSGIEYLGQLRIFLAD